MESTCAVIIESRHLSARSLIGQYFNELRLYLAIGSDRLKHSVDLVTKGVVEGVVFLGEKGDVGDAAEADGVLRVIALIGPNVVLE